MKALFFCWLILVGTVLGRIEPSEPEIVWKFDVDYAGSIAVADGRVFIGAVVDETAGSSLICLDLKSGTELWRSKHEPTFRPRGFSYYPITSTPAIAGKLAYYISANWEFVCVDVEGFRDGKNDGPFQTEADVSESAADFIWKIDLVEDLGIEPRMAGDVGYLQPSPIVVGDRVFVVTGNGSDNWRKAVAAPDAPSFLAVDRHSGAVIWGSSLPGKGIHWMQGGTPAAVGDQQLLWPGGDGFVYALRVENGELTGKLDLNEVIGTERQFFTNQFVVDDGTLFTGIGEGMEIMRGSKLRQPLVAIDIDRLTNGEQNSVRWIYRNELGRIWGTPAVSDGTVFVNFRRNHLVALDVDGGTLKWETTVGFYDDDISLYTAPLILGDRLYVASVGGEISELNAETGERLRYWEFQESFSEHATPIATPDGLIVLTRAAAYRLKLGHPGE
ncbi:MAG: outer membrane protein assembly factor BamB [Verrucomicrobiales bacterium]|jgi:outer membrane protein assembly factor BamB